MKIYTIEEENLFKEALRVWGKQAQVGMAIEECAEFIRAVMKLGRNHNGSTKEDVIDEIADVIIMMQQMRILFGEHEVDNRIEFKLKRLEEHLK